KLDFSRGDFEIVASSRHARVEDRVLAFFDFPSIRKTVEPKCIFHYCVDAFDRIQEYRHESTEKIINSEVYRQAVAIVAIKDRRSNFNCSRTLQADWDDTHL